MTTPRRYHTLNEMRFPCALQDGFEACALCEDEAEAYAREAGALGSDGPPLDPPEPSPYGCVACGHRLSEAYTHCPFCGAADPDGAPAPGTTYGTSYGCFYGCTCNGPCAPGGCCGCPCHKMHHGWALEDGTFANCECRRWTRAQLIQMTRDEWAESGQKPPAYALAAARRG